MNRLFENSGRSDSSMDDCNPLTREVKMFVIEVQIPLWTIVTRPKILLFKAGTGVQIPLWTIVT